MSMKRLLGLALLPAIWVSSVWAEEEAVLPPKYFHLGSVVAKTDENRLADDGAGIQFSFGMPVNQRVAFEFRLTNLVFESGVTGATDFYHRTLGADAVYSFGDRTSLTPYLLLGGGIASNDVLPDSKDGYDAYGNIGVGLTGSMLDLDWLRGRIEARAVYDGFDGGQLDYQFSGGIEIPVGVVRTEVRTVEKVVELPAPAPLVREVIKEVPIEIVRQVEVIKEVPVEVVRIVEVTPPDADQDGIADVRDNCPLTPAGATTDNHGCVIKSAVIRLENLLFQTNSSVITVSSDKTLDMAVGFLANQPQVKVEVAGHTDNVGHARKNRTLSLQRAKAVVRALKARGVKNTLQPTGYGATQPVLPNTSDKNRQRNRRVELRVLSN